MQGSIKCHFLSFWYDSTWDWTPSPGPFPYPLLIRTMVRSWTQFDGIYIFKTPIIIPQNNNWKNVKREISTWTLLENWKKIWNTMVTIILIVIGAFGPVTKGSLKGLENLEVGSRVETIQKTALLKATRILRRVLETWGDLLSLDLLGKTIMSINNNNNRMKESEKRVKYLNLARVLKRLRNMNMMVIPIVVDAFGKVPKVLERGPEE